MCVVCCVGVVCMSGSVCLLECDSWMYSSAMMTMDTAKTAVTMTRPTLSAVTAGVWLCFLGRALCAWYCSFLHAVTHLCRTRWWWNWSEPGEQQQWPEQHWIQSQLGEVSARGCRGWHRTGVAAIVRHSGCALKDKRYILPYVILAETLADIELN